MNCIQAQLSPHIGDLNNQSLDEVPSHQSQSMVHKNSFASRTLKKVNMIAITLLFLAAIILTSYVSTIGVCLLPAFIVTSLLRPLPSGFYGKILDASYTVCIVGGPLLMTCFSSLVLIVEGIAIPTIFKLCHLPPTFKDISLDRDIQEEIQEDSPALELKKKVNDIAEPLFYLSGLIACHLIGFGLAGFIGSGFLSFFSWKSRCSLVSIVGYALPPLGLALTFACYIPLVKLINEKIMPKIFPAAHGPNDDENNYTQTT